MSDPPDRAQSVSFQLSDAPRAYTIVAELKVLENPLKRSGLVEKWKPGDPIPTGHGKVLTTEDGEFWVCSCGFQCQTLEEMGRHYGEVKK